MSRRKDNSPAISFFSFQDIITSVTGIMFLVVLILILMLLMRKDAATTPEEREDIRQTEALKEELAKLQEEFADRTKSISDLQKRLDELKKLKLEECPARVASLNAELLSLEQANKAAEEKALDVKVHLESLKESMANLENLMRMGGEKLKASKEKEALLTAKITELQKKIQAVKKTVRFTWQRNSSKTPLLVECSEDTIRVGTSDAEQPLSVFTEKNPESLAKNFMKWVEGYDASSHYVLLLVKPAAFTYAELLSYLLQEKGYERGREILPNDTVEIFQDGGKK